MFLVASLRSGNAPSARRTLGSAGGVVEPGGRILRAARPPLEPALVHLRDTGTQEHTPRYETQRAARGTREDVDYTVRPAFGGVAEALFVRYKTTDNGGVTVSAQPATPQDKPKSARSRARKSPDAHRNTKPNTELQGYLKGASLYRVVLPSRTVNGREYGEACFGVYVRDGFAIMAPPIGRWMVGQSWDEKILPWLRKNNARGRMLEPGERLAV